MNIGQAFDILDRAYGSQEGAARALGRTLGWYNRARNGKLPLSESAMKYVLLAAETVERDGKESLARKGEQHGDG